MQKSSNQKLSTAESSRYLGALRENATRNGVYDSALAADFITTTTSQGESSTSVRVPDRLQAVLDECSSEGQQGIARALIAGAEEYERSHGCPVPGDVVEQAIHTAYGCTRSAARRYSLDSAADSNHQDNRALQPNRAVVSILSIFSEAISFAHYLPADIGSNEAVLAIMSHNAGSTYGSYRQGAGMDGHLSGESYIDSSRLHVCTVAGTAITGKITTVQDTPETCDPTADSVKLLRGRSLVYVSGLEAAREISTTGSGPSTVSGQITLGGSTYQISGTIDTDTGDIDLVSSPAIPATLPVMVQAFIDYERDPAKVPSIITAVETFKLHAKPWRVLTHQSIDSRTQMANELGLDPYSESVMAIQQQYANERHYSVLGQARRIAVNNSAEFDFSWTQRNATMNRSQIWYDLAPVLGALSQQMALDTNNHGISHLYVGKEIAAQWMGLSRDIFDPSGISERPGIYRVGRLFGRYEVYYTPRVVTGSDAAAQILCIGRGTDVTRNPFILGDAVPPSIIPLATNGDLKQGAGFYARNFTAVNPHAQSALGCAVINVLNMA